MFESLYNEGVNINMISTSEIHITVLINEKRRNPGYECSTRCFRPCRLIKYIHSKEEFLYEKKYWECFLQRNVPVCGSVRLRHRKPENYRGSRRLLMSLRLVQKRLTLSDSLYDFQVKIGDKVYQFLCITRIFCSNWTLGKNGDPEMGVGTNSYGSISFYKGDDRVSVDDDQSWNQPAAIKPVSGSRN